MARLYPKAYRPSGESRSRVAPEGLPGPAGNHGVARHPKVDGPGWNSGTASRQPGREPRAVRGAWPAKFSGAFTAAW
jgi:hypothetical protein